MLYLIVTSIIVKSKKNYCDLSDSFYVPMCHNFLLIHVSRRGVGSPPVADRPVFGVEGGIAPKQTLKPFLSAAIQSCVAGGGLPVYDRGRRRGEKRGWGPV